MSFFRLAPHGKQGLQSEFTTFIMYSMLSLKYCTETIPSLGAQDNISVGQVFIVRHNTVHTSIHLDFI